VKIAGENTLHADVSRAWDALLDPSVLVATIPAAAALAAAISDAEGFFVDRMPLSPSELWELRERHTRKEER